MLRFDVIPRMALVLLTSLAMTGRVLTQNVSEVTVNVFPGGFNWGIYVA